MFSGGHRHYGRSYGHFPHPYQRVLFSPGMEINFHPVKVYADVELPVYQHVTGNQLVAPALFKMVVSYMF